ncbi:polysaccharide deacetylase family protein [Pseudoxanthomonas suwonensis]|uniref:Polysaccharide deacetylase n=1 Tax=Pseudoxanthomonas suwonensis TaxID=314722 RepID=A0A0E3ULW7_9GAMM|nr:polysaccharide deacetylase family protein [Pseudoxanthomonas suwonensis]AKC85510.1 polysaccharide deacetylase [Pseudoxanthomonas suwonensis]
MRTVRFFALLAAVTVGLAVTGWQIAKSRTYQTFGELISEVHTESRLVALTFDDGPAPEAVSKLLPVLHEHGVKATFFVTGAELERYPEAAAALVAAGHELGNHSYSHPRMVFISQAKVASEVERTDELIRAAGQLGDIHFRPPHGIKAISLPYFLKKTGRRTVMWSLEPDSGSQIASSSNTITKHVIDNSKPGDIILLHVMYNSRRASLEAVPGIIEGLQLQGFQFVTVSELLAEESSR